MLSNKSAPANVTRYYKYLLTFDEINKVDKTLPKPMASVQVNLKMGFPLQNILCYSSVVTTVHIYMYK